MAVIINSRASDFDQFFLASEPSKESGGVAVALSDIQADTDSTVGSILPITYASIHQGSWMPLDIQQSYLASSISADQEISVQPSPDGEDRLGLEGQESEAIQSNEANLFFNALSDKSPAASAEEIVGSASPAAGVVGSSSLLPAETLFSNQVGQSGASGEVLEAGISQAGFASVSLDTPTVNPEILPLGLIFPESSDSTISLQPLFTDAADIVDFNAVAPNSFIPDSQLDALGGGDIVTLPETLSLATKLGFNILSFAAGAGDDTIFVGDLGFEVSGDTGDDTLLGGSGDDVLKGGDDNDLLQGGVGADELVGGAGSDTASYASSDSGVNVNLGTGAASGGHAQGDTLSGIENVTGSAFDDVLKGTNAANIIAGSTGIDSINAKGGADTVYGGADADSINAGGGSDLVYGEEGDDVIEGGAGGDIIYGGAGEDIISGGGGSDVIEGGAGADELDGGAGKDMATYTDSSSSVTVNLTTGTGSGGDAEGDTLTNIENLTGSAFNDTLTGDSGANTMLGGGGDDALAGEGGKDRLFGGEGDDLLTGGAGSDKLFGEAGDDALVGDAGNDSLVGGEGDDILTGGAGKDKLFGDSGIDTASYESSSSGVTVNLETGKGKGGDAKGDRLFDIENVTGSDFNDVLTGNASDNVLTGGAGDDVLKGSAGNDVFLFDVGNDANTVFGGTGGTDTLSLEGVTDPSDWTLVLSTGSIVSQGDDFINLSSDASGTLTYNDMTTTIDFTDLESITW